MSFSASRSSDPDGSISSYLWKINGTQVSISRDFSYSLGKGTHQIYLTVTDNLGAQGSVGASIIVTEETPNQFLISTISFPQTVGTPFSVIVTAVDANGNRLSGFNSYVSLTSNLGAVSPTSANLVSGQATVSVKLYTPGTTRLNCSGYGAYGDSNYFNVTGGSSCTGCIVGNVIDCKKDAVFQAAVLLYDVEGNQVGNKTTDGKGLFDSDPLPCGKYEIRVDKDGELKTGIWLWVGHGFCSSAYDILLPLNCVTKDTPVVLVPGMMSSSEWYWGIVPRLPLTTPDASELYIHAEKKTGFQKLKQELDLHYYVVECPWDWRMKSDEAYKKYLRNKIDEALKKSTTGKVHIVAHSMGGLVVRAYIQSKDETDGYKGDIDKVAFVGTPHQGSCNPYYIWEGGDPVTVDNLTSSWMEPYKETIEELWKDTYRRPGWGEKHHKEIRTFVRDEVQSLLELMYTKDFLTDWFSYWGTGDSGNEDNVNTWLNKLNQGLDRG